MVEPSCFLFYGSPGNSLRANGTVCDLGTFGDRCLAQAADLLRRQQPPRPDSSGGLEAQNQFRSPRISAGTLSRGHVNRHSLARPKLPAFASRGRQSRSFSRFWLNDSTPVLVDIDNVDYVPAADSAGKVPCSWLIGLVVGKRNMECGRRRDSSLRRRRSE
jgi:hypothetical protein